MRAEMRLPSDNEIARFDQRAPRVALATRVTSVVFILFGAVCIVAPLAAGEPEAMVPGFSLLLVGAALLLLAIGKPDVAVSSTYFSVAQGRAWWNGLKVIAHLCAFGYAWLAVGAFITPSWAQISPSIRTPTAGASFIVIALVSLVLTILMDCNYFHRPALEVSPRGVTVQYFRRRLHIPLADIGKVMLFPQGAGEIHIYPADGCLVQREVRGYFTPSTKDQSIPIYVLRNGVTAQQVTENLTRFSRAASTPRRDRRST